MNQSNQMGSPVLAPPISATQWIFGRETLEVTAARLAALGYDGVELAGEPAARRVDEVRSILDTHGLGVTSICGMYTSERDLSHPSAALRDGAVAYVRACAAFGAALGAPLLIVVPTAVGRTRPEASRKQEWGWAVDSIRRGADVAAAHGVRIVLEALNRYESYLVNSLEDAAQLAADVDRENVGLMADLFHMNIEETSPAAAIEALHEQIWHIHLADSNRRAPGLGHTDFVGVLRALRAVDYRGALTLEFLPSSATPYVAASLDVGEDEKRLTAQQGVDYIRGLWG